MYILYTDGTILHTVCVMVRMRFRFSLASPDLLLVIILCLSDLDLSLLIGQNSRQLGDLVRFHYFSFTKRPDNVNDKNDKNYSDICFVPLLVSA